MRPFGWLEHVRALGSTSTGRAVFTHPALFYGSDAEYVHGLVPFITDGLAAGHPVAVAVPGPNLDLLRSALGTSADRVHGIDMTVAGRNPARIIAGVLRRFADAHLDRHVRIVGEPIWPGRSAIEYPACAQHEALINAAFAGRDVTIVCPYDTVGLHANAIADARRTHPVLWQADQRQPSPDYAPDEVVTRYNQPLSHVTGALWAYIVAMPADLIEVRRRIADRAQSLGLAPERLPDLELIATELATNSLIHAHGPCELRIWDDGVHLVCEAKDAGELNDALAGRRPARSENRNGRGLLLINDLSDLVRIHTGPGGTTIRAYLRRDVSGAFCGFIRPVARF